MKYFVEPRLTLRLFSIRKTKQNNPIFDSDQLFLSNNELYSNNDRFSGMDRIGDQSFYTLSMDIRKCPEGHEKISLDVSKKYYLKDRKVWMPIRY